MAARAKPIANLSLTIQGPGFGSLDATLGNAANRRYGSARPRPRAPKTRKISPVLPAKAKPTAVPTNGAEHGVANKVAKAPCRKCPENPFILVDLTLATGMDCGSRKSKNPHKLHVKIVISKVRHIRNQGC